MITFYQNLPQHLNPVAFQVGSFSVRWYSIMYLMAIFVFYSLLLYRIRKKENRDMRIDADFIINYLCWSFLGLLIGARLGHVFIYNFSFYFQNPWKIISPFDGSGKYVGIYGMSYFGGLIGIILVSLLYLRIKKINVWSFSDFVIPAIPAGYFFGRLGNFLNGELYGKVTNFFWGMYFGKDAYLRYPTQLYEAFLEGVLLFAVFWIFRNSSSWKGKFLSFYLVGYGTVRFFCEFLRDPIEKSLFLNISQVLSIVLIISGLIILWKKKNIV